jgi:hypothetical protein
LPVGARGVEAAVLAFVAVELGVLAWNRALTLKAAVLRRARCPARVELAQ